MIYIYRREPSDGARELAAALGAKRWRGTSIPMERKAVSGDIVICWGEALPAIDGVKVLNGAPLQDKIKDALVLKEHNIPTIEIRLEPPAPIVPGRDPAEVVWHDLTEELSEFLNNDFARNAVYQKGIEDLTGKLGALLGHLKTPLPTPVEWIPRLRHHVGGNDLLNPPSRPDFWVKKERIHTEVRIHSFKWKSIRAGVKTLRDGFIGPNVLPELATLPPGISRAHPWVRSWDAGYRIYYDGGPTINQSLRNLAHSAVAALGLDFGAVDLALRPDGTMFVLEVNRAPGIEAGTIDAYARGINRWLEEQGAGTSSPLYDSLTAAIPF